MSDLTSCNYCSLKSLRCSLKGSGAHIRLVRENGGVAVYVIPKGEKLGAKRVDGEPSKQWRRWFMELSDRCAC